MELNQLSIEELRKAIIQRKISAYEIAKNTLKAIEKHNPILNAWTKITKKRMLNEAKIIDKKQQQNKTLGLLAGIPYAVKNLFDVAGHITQTGSELFENNQKAQKDAWTIKKLSEHGALLSGMLNMDAYAYGFTTENSYYGSTRNPHDINRIAGGSSGGSAAAVAAGIVHFSLGTDTNGSVRVPASLCGTFALKPTFGRLSRTGIHPFSPSLDHVGLFARCVHDLALVYDVLQGIDKLDYFQAKRPIKNTYLSLNKSKKNKNLRYAKLGGYYDLWCDKNTKTALNLIAKNLKIDHEIILPEVDLARSAAFILTASEAGNQYLPKLKKTPEKFEINSRERILAGAMIPSAWYIQAQRFRRYFQKQVLPLFKKYDILIAPATPCSATLIDQESIFINNKNLFIKSSMGILTQPISFLGLPVCSVPIKTNNTLPIGLQLISAPFREDITLHAAHILEKIGLTLPQKNF